MYAHYETCDPITAKEVEKNDQVTGIILSNKVPIVQFGDLHRFCRIMWLRWLDLFPVFRDCL